MILISPLWPSLITLVPFPRILLKKSSRQSLSATLKYLLWSQSCVIMTPARLYQLLAKGRVTGWVALIFNSAVEYHLGRRVVTPLIIKRHTALVTGLAILSSGHFRNWSDYTCTTQDCLCCAPIHWGMPDSNGSISASVGVSYLNAQQALEVWVTGLITEL